MLLCAKRKTNSNGHSRPKPEIPDCHVPFSQNDVDSLKGPSTTHKRVQPSIGSGTPNHFASGL